MQNAFAALTTLKAGRSAAVLATPDVAKEVEKLEPNRRHRLLAVMEKFAEYGFRMPKEQFRSEGRFGIGDPSGKEIQIFAFKGWQVRVYAGELPRGGQRTLICTAIDPAKKTDGADQALLRTAARRMKPFLDVSREGARNVAQR